MPDHTAPATVTLRSPSIEVDILDAGASIRSIRLPGLSRHSVVVGALDPAVYGPGNRTFLGASVGRHANRIAHSRFSLDGEEHRLSVNEPPHHLHGGLSGSWARDWSLREASDRHAVFAISSPDGEDGYPGYAELVATFAIAEDGVLSIAYDGTVDRPSILNLTSHLYFNLSGRPSTQDHALRIAADAYLPVDAALIPTGAVRDVTGGPFDFRTAKALADGPESLDHCFCLSEARQATPRHALTLSSSEAGIAMDLETTEPGVQIYDGAKFDGSIVGLDGAGIGAHGGIAIEPQTWPNAPNVPGFPSATVLPGEPYRHLSRYRFRRI